MLGCSILLFTSVGMVIFGSWFAYSCYDCRFSSVVFFFHGSIHCSLNLQYSSSYKDTFPDVESFFLHRSAGCSWQCYMSSMEITGMKYGSQRTRVKYSGWLNYYRVTIHARHVAASHGRDQKKTQCCIVHGSRKQCQCSANHEVVMRALSIWWSQNIFRALHSFSATMQPLYWIDFMPWMRPIPTPYWLQACSP